MKNRFLPLVFAVAMLVPYGLFGQSVSIWDGTSEIWTRGQGTESSPYLIENAQQLAYIAEMVNGGVTHYDNTYFKLTTNVQIDSITPWQPIGLNETYYFGGKFDGDNHLVTLHLNTSTLKYVGIFGYARNASFENIGVSGAITITSWSATVGGIIGYYYRSSDGYVTNCYSNCEIFCSSSNGDAGGIIGSCLFNSDSQIIISNCHNSGNIHAHDSGGIVGYVCENSYNNQYTSLYNCYNTGMIKGEITGGIVGCIGSKRVNSYVSASQSIIKCYNNGILFGKSAGGIVGYVNAHRVNLNIVNCLNTGSINAMSFSSNSANLGGIVGSTYIIYYSNYPPCVLSLNVINSYNTGCLNSNSFSTCNCGGIVGGMDAGQYSSESVAFEGAISYYLTNSYNAGTMNGSNNYGIAYYKSNYTYFTNCHYLNTCGGEGSGTAKTEAQMKSPSFPVILNTDSVVFVMDCTPNINQGYPIFGNVTTLDAENVGSTVATLKGTYQMLYDVDTHGFEYKKSSESDYTIVNTSGEGPVSYNASGLQGGTEYTYRFFVQKDGVTYRGLDKTFNTVQCSLSASITSSSNTLCAGDTLAYTVTASSNSASEYQYTWNTGETERTILIADGSTYTVTVTDNYGCTATQSKQMTVYPAAVASITGSTVLCNNSTITLTANGGTYYSWNTGSAQRTITVTQPGTYIATVQTVYGCTASDTVEVTNFAAPVISGNTAFCAGDYTTLTASGGDDYLWSTGATTPAINVNTAGTYSVTATTTNNCSATTSVTVIQNQASDVVILGNTVICSGIGTSLTSSTGVSYLWSTGETTQSIAANNPGIYSVTVTNSNGCSSSASQIVSYMEMPTITGNAAICSGENTILSANASGSYLWNTGAVTPSITVNTPGNYSVTVSLPNGCSSSASVNVTTASLPTPAINGNTTICQGETATLVATGGTSYQWSAMGQGNSITVTEAGTYTVTATNAQGCSATASTYVTVNPLPNITISGNTAVCQGNTTTLVANGAQSYQWNTGSTNAAISVGSAGNFTVTGYSAQGCTNSNSVYVEIYPTYNTPVSHAMCQGETYNFFGQNLTNAGTYSHALYTQNGCDSVITLTLTVRDLPVVAINGNTTICQGETATLVATGGTSYQWSAMGQGNSITVTEAGTYTVTATNAQGCSATASTYVTVNPLPNITISGNTAVCQGNTTTLVANGAAIYQWSNGVSGAVNTIGTFGIYTVTGISAEGCSSTASATVVVYQLPVLNISGDTQLCSGETTTLTANGAATYLWNNGTTDAALTTSAAGTYTVIGTAEHGCYSTASIDVAVNYPSSTEVTVVECDSYEWQGITRTESGDYTWTGQTTAGCDSIIILHLTINESVTTEMSETASNNYEWHGTTYTESGDYTWTGQTANGCDSTVTLHLTITTGVNEWGDGHFTVYPNPTTGMVNVQFSMNNVQLENVDIQIFDVYGKRLQIVSVTDETTQIDLSSYAPGVYLIQMVGDGRVMGVRKVVRR